MIKIACATKDKECFTGEHFGEADYYIIFKLTENKCIYDCIIENIPFDEDKHGHKKKAQHIKKLFKQKGVNVVANDVFGKNISRINKKFVAAVSRVDNIKEALDKINLKKIEKLINEKNNNQKKIIYIK